MIYKNYGKTGKKVSAIGFGGMRFPNPEDIDANAQIVLDTYEKGVNYFDTAPGYCEDKSEDIMGAAFRAMKPGTFFTSSKCGKPDGKEFRASLEKSLKRLGLERITFFHIWWVLSLEAWQGRKAGGAVAEALKAKKEGLIEHVVISSHMSGEDIAKVFDENIVEGATLGYCAINFPYRQKAVDDALKRGLGVAAMNPLGGGLIPQHSDKFDFIRGPNDPDVVTAALRFIVSQPGISTAIVGFSSKQHVDQACAAIENFAPYDRQHLDAIEKKVLGTFNELCTGCGYCMPCPAGVNIPQYMDVYNTKMLGDGSEKELLDRLQWQWGIQASGVNACTQCGLCEKKCTQHLPIRQRLAEISKLPDWGQ